jgi:5-(carboxyamino)imidazole ribonucleotide synthase
MARKADQVGRQEAQMKTLDRPVPPGGTIGILGGGQLGRMLALAASRLGLKSLIYSDLPDVPAFQVTPLQIVAPYDDRATLSALANVCDAVTFEFENIPAEAVEFLGGLVPVRPGATALAITQDRFNEKSFVESLGLRTAPFAEVNTDTGARAAFELVGPGILKTRRMGYDGKGQMRAIDAEDAALAIKALQNVPCIYEGFIDFAFEASVIAARGADGAFAAYDPPENVHEHHILRRSTVPGRLSGPQGEEAKAIARKIADSLDYVGVLAVELFVCKDGALLVNEIAPRVHNSGHWTLEACTCSQFEQHIRAVAGWPLGDSVRHADAVMENIIGDEVRAWESLAKAGALHLYGKKEVKPGRKMGHLTRLIPRSK